MTFDSEEQKQLFASLIAAFENVPVSGPMGEVRKFLDEVSVARAAVQDGTAKRDPSLDALTDR